MVAWGAAASCACAASCCWGIPPQASARTAANQAELRMVTPIPPGDDRRIGHLTYAVESRFRLDGANRFWRIILQRKSFSISSNQEDHAHGTTEGQQDAREPQGRVRRR